MVTNEQVYLVVFVSMLGNAVIVAMGIAFLEMKFRARERRYKDR